ncbi:GNAT family N-acetyltransferase [Neiella litorisoli]|uniref:GNAT family N-acetyltransferase n=1 Tax=Neiella litorisoli TaxID=2771431 RepID=UPI0034E2305A
MLLVADSKRLQFELMSAKDAELLFQLDQDPQVMRFINGGKCTTREEIAKVYVPRMESYSNPAKGWGIWKVCLKANGEFLGWVLVRPMDFFTDTPQYNNLELGWRFHRKAWGQGYGTEAAQAIANAVIGLGEAKWLTAIALEDNHASIGIMKKLGMSYLKTGIHRDPLGDVEVVYYQCSVL